VSAAKLIAANAVTLDRHKLAWLLLPLFLAYLPHYDHSPAWLLGIVAVVFAWRVLILVRGYGLPPRWLLIALSVAGLIGTYFTYRTIAGRTPGVGLLMLLLSLKLLELRSLRDAMVVVFLAYFLVLTNFLFSQTIPMALMMTLIVLLVTAALIGLNTERMEMAPRAKLRLATSILLQAIPLMLLLFLLFPRVQGPLWRTPADAQSGISGLSDNMSPGSINRLTLSDAIAFRARFEALPPKPSQLYWRGPVLWDYDGQTWRTTDIRRLRTLEFDAENPPVDYTVTLEPSEKIWLFALELAAQLPPNSRVTADYQILANEPVRNRLSYPMRSYVNFKARPVEDSLDLAPALRLPGGFNPRTLALAREWKAQLKDDEAIMRRALTEFREKEFIYTLTPPLLGRDSIDEFMFSTRQGFCEHYSGAFVFLMRAAGIPARVVTGYLGGEINPVDQYMVVRQSDAHAWAEVWLQRRGWIRVDPTAAVAPGRVETGLAAAVRSGDVLPFFVRTNLPWLRTLRYNWDALANAWNQAVLGFNPDRQREVLARFGMDPDWMNMSIVLTLSCGTLLLGFALYLTRRYRAIDPVSRAYLRFCRKLARSGVQRRPDEGPLDFAMRAAAALPNLAHDILAISQQYIELRYGPSSAPDGAGAARAPLSRFRACVARFPV
jgi:transglutaminase-like putative cysteine protease